MLYNALQNYKLTDGDIISFFYTGGSSPNTKKTNLIYKNSDGGHIYTQEQNGQFKTFSLEKIHSFSVESRAKVNSAFEAEKASIEDFLSKNPNYEYSLVQNFNNKWCRSFKFDVKTNKLIDNARKEYKFEVFRNVDGTIKEVKIIGELFSVRATKSTHSSLIHNLETLLK